MGKLTDEELNARFQAIEQLLIAHSNILGKVLDVLKFVCRLVGVKVP